MLQRKVRQAGTRYTGCPATCYPLLAALRPDVVHVLFRNVRQAGRRYTGCRAGVVQKVPEYSAYLLPSTGCPQTEHGFRRGRSTTSALLPLQVSTNTTPYTALCRWQFPSPKPSTRSITHASSQTYTTQQCHTTLSDG